MALWNAAVVILTAVTTLVALRAGVTHALLSEINEILEEDVAEIKLMLSEIPASQFPELKHELQRKAEGHRQHGWFVELYGEKGVRLWSTKSADSSLDNPVTSDNSDVQNAQDLLTFKDDADENEHGVKWIVVGAQLTLLRYDLSRIDELVVLTATLIFAIAPIFAYWLAGRATNAVGEITRTASRLRPDKLEERLPLRGTGDELDQLAQTINGSTGSLSSLSISGTSWRMRRTSSALRWPPFAALSRSHSTRSGVPTSIRKSWKTSSIRAARCRLC